MSTSSAPSLAQLSRALAIAEKIAALEQQFAEIIRGSAPSSGAASAPAPAAGKRAPKGRKKRFVSPEARARMAEAQRQRWARARKK